MKKGLVLLVALLLVTAFALASCGEAELGTEENPLIWVLVPSGETETVLSSFDAVADLLYEETELVVEPFVATEYAGAIEAMCSDPPKAHIASLATFAYMLASERGCAEAELVSVRFGSPSYNGQVITRADSGISELADLEGKTFCRSDPLSTSGWIIPSLEIKGAGVDPETGLADVVDSGSHDATVSGVYNGDCDAGATYVDARGTIEEDHPDVMDVISVIYVTGDIPNDGVQYVPSLDAELRAQVSDGLLAIMATEEGQTAIFDSYEWNELAEKSDAFYDAFRQILDAAGVSAADLQ